MKPKKGYHPSKETTISNLPANESNKKKQFQKLRGRDNIFVFLVNLNISLLVQIIISL